MSAEKDMNGLVIVLIGIVVLFAGYLFYGRWLAKKWGLDPKAETPAVKYEDGEDYVPSSKFTVFSHQFSSIAGAGPVTGPIIAAMFGWLPVLLWLLIGGIFFGAVQDFTALYASVKNEFDAVVDKCEVVIYTDPAECTRIRHEVAIPIFDKRDERLDTLTDESVDVYYSCILCQAFSPSHVCVVTPERLGLCGAVSWLDAKATNELDPNGPCQVITKERPIDENLGSYEDVDEAVQKFSQGALEHVTLYSIMQDPMTSCGCFECICGIEPFSNGVVIANREYAGMTPLGMTFPEMASMTGGGVQTPGFMGHGKHFIASKKFMKAEGGVARIVWMPKELKEQVAEKLNETAKELYGIDNFTDMIGDETIAEDPETLVAFLTEKGHPALGMDPMM